MFYRRASGTSISIDRLDGICYVQHLTDESQIEAWIKHDNHFFLNQEGDEEELLMTSRHDFSFCEQCHKDARKVIHNTKQFLRENSKLTGMELFSGMKQLFFYTLWLMLLNRCWGFRSWHESVWVC